MFIYNCNRLIKMYERVGPQLEGGVNCSGVLGIVDVPYLVLEPTHNKQDFADAKEYRHLLKSMGDHLEQYWKDLGIVQQGVTKFWENFGYISPLWKEPPSNDTKYLRKRAMQLPVTIQCDSCLKWRVLPFSASNLLNKDIPDYWVCEMNPDTSHNRCTAGEQKYITPLGQLKKEAKSSEDKKKGLLEEIRRREEKLQKLEKTTVVTLRNHLPSREPSPEVERLRKPNRPVGKASPVVSPRVIPNKEKTVSKPIGKASPVVNSSRSRPTLPKVDYSSSHPTRRTSTPSRKPEKIANTPTKIVNEKKIANTQKRKPAPVLEKVIPSDSESDDIPTKKKKNVETKDTQRKLEKNTIESSTEENMEIETDASCGSSDIDDNNE
uniref:MORC family CW-type zinc finger protein 2-like n=1 Tax=Saccoglossus kowalevskii TaxID=10224 RepID=A0ABM0MBF8_SACKO